MLVKFPEFFPFFSFSLCVPGSLSRYYIFVIGSSYGLLGSDCFPDFVFDDIDKF